MNDFKVIVDNMKARRVDLALSPAARKFAASKTALYFVRGVEGQICWVPLDHLDSAPTPVAVRTPSAVFQKAKLSKEEELLRERQRTVTFGVTSFAIVNPDTDSRETPSALIMATGATLTALLRNGTSVNLTDLIKEALAESLRGAIPIDYQHSPSDPCHVAFVAGGNFYSVRMALSDDSATIVDACAHSSGGNDVVTFATADYIMQEEFGRFTGFSWSQRGDRAVLAIVDSTRVPVHAFLGRDDDIEKMSFPRVGETNAVTAIAVRDMRSGAATQNYRVLPASAITRAFPGAEYVVRFGFVGDSSDVIWVQVLDRTQEHGAIFEVAVADLPIAADAADAVAKSFGAVDSTVALTPVWRQHLPWAWIDVGNDYLVSTEHRTRVILASGGHGRFAGPTPPTAEHDTSFAHIFTASLSSTDAASPPEWTQITSGNWNVRTSSVQLLPGGAPSSGKPLGALFLATKDDPMVIGLFHVFLEGPQRGTITRLSNADECLSSFSIVERGAEGAKETIVVYTASTVSAPVQTMWTSLSVVSNALQRTTPAVIPDTAPLRGGRTAAMIDQVAIEPEYISCRSANGGNLLGLVFANNRGDLTPRPLLLHVYGGPHVQRVFKRYELKVNGLHQALAAQGFIVVYVDNCLATSNSLRVQSRAKHGLSSFETKDHIDFVQHLMTVAPSLRGGGFAIDPARIAISGWSYGGYATLLAMSQAACFFKLGIAGAPVGDWLLYDTGYTERYMGVLPDKADAYKASAIRAHASGFPDEFNRLFIAHGLMDENVHFNHSAHVVSALVEQGKPFVLWPYPGERHRLVQKPESQAHFDAMSIRVLLQFL